MTLFPERQAAIKVLYQAAAQLLDDAANFTGSCGRDINRNLAQDCVLLAEKIAKMGPIKITIDNLNADVVVEGIPFGLSFVVKNPVVF